MKFNAKDFAGNNCGKRYQQDYRATLGPNGKESGTLECIKFYYDGRIRLEQHCYGEAATFVFGIWATDMDEDGTIHWDFSQDKRKAFYDEQYLPKALTSIDEDGHLHFDGTRWPWKCADDFTEDARWGYPRWKVILGKLFKK